MSEPDLQATATPTKRSERRVFLFITVFLFPILSVMIVGGYGFAIWMLQLIFGPPGTH